MDITTVIEAAVALLAAIVSVVLIPWLTGKIGEQNMGQLVRWVQIAVAAAQQLYHDVDGQARKDYVLKFLADKGFKVDDAGLDAIIEAAVLELHEQLLPRRGEVIGDGT